MRRDRSRVGYRYETTRDDYGDLASGAVLRSAPGFPAFPVRLASEVFQHALDVRGGTHPVVLWDPCCGSGYLLTVLGILHRRSIARLLASDIDADAALTLAAANVGLLAEGGLAARAAELTERARRFDKPGYAEAAAAAGRLSRRLEAAGGPLPYAVRQADVFDPTALASAVGGSEPDLVVTDVPYGEQTEWTGGHAGRGLHGMLTAVASVLRPAAVIAVIVRGRRVPPIGAARPRRKLRVGTRAAALFVAADLNDAGPAHP